MNNSIENFEKVIFVASSRFVGNTDFDDALNASLHELGELSDGINMQLL